MEIDIAHLYHITGTNASILSKYVKPLNETMEKYQINTPLRQCHFLAQICHESGAFKRTEENLNYSAKGLLSTFPKYFTQLTANQYARQPEAIANRVYANRMGNGTEASGDGWRYRGRGLIQITGHDNYSLLAKSFLMGIMENPDKVANVPLSVLSAGWYWDRCKLNQYADKDDLNTITKRINGGYNGISDRKEWLVDSKVELKCAAEMDDVAMYLMKCRSVIK